MSTPPTSPGTSIVDNNALTGALRTLKLGGMLQTLDARLHQARAGELGHLEFLQVLCEDEITRRDTTALARRVRHARFEHAATLEDFDFAYYAASRIMPRRGRRACSASTLAGFVSA